MKKMSWQFQKLQIHVTTITPTTTSKKQASCDEELLSESIHIKDTNTNASHFNMIIKR